MLGRTVVYRLAGLDDLRHHCSIGRLSPGLGAAAEGQPGLHSNGSHVVESMKQEQLLVYYVIPFAQLSTIVHLIAFDRITIYCRHILNRFCLHRSSTNPPIPSRMQRVLRCSYPHGKTYSCLCELPPPHLPRSCKG